MNLENPSGCRNVMISTLTDDDDDAPVVRPLRTNSETFWD